jgi:hypothetical protein
MNPINRRRLKEFKLNSLERTQAHRSSKACFNTLIIGTPLCGIDISMTSSAKFNYLKTIEVNMSQHVRSIVY